jgi:hypothetical protein
MDTLFLATNTDVPGGTKDFLEGTCIFWTQSAIQLRSLGFAPATAGSECLYIRLFGFTKVGGQFSDRLYCSRASFFCKVLLLEGKLSLLTV